MKDDIEKLAKAMKDLKPSKDAKQAGLDAAMAAFDAEFGPESEKISDGLQGSEAAARPMGQTVPHAGVLARVQTMRTHLMTQTRKLFAMKPQTMMMTGTCAAALIAGVIIVPQTDFFAPVPGENIATEVQAPDNATEETATPDDVLVVTGNRLPTEAGGETPNAGAVASDVAPDQTPAPAPELAIEQAPAVAPAPAPKPEVKKDGIQSVDGLLSEIQSAPPQIEREANFRQRMANTEARVAPQMDRAVIGFPVEPAPVPTINNDKFESFESNPVKSVKESPVSTFSVDVDTASYAFLRSSLNRGIIPQPSAIRLEEMINYFPYDYQAPRSADTPFKANVTVTETPWNSDTKLMHIGVKGYVPPASERPDSNLVLLIDTSGSMNQPNKLPLLINSFKLLLNTLDEGDTVSIVTYAGSAGTVLEPTPADEKGTILAALENLRAGGSTAGAAGLELAYQKAKENFDADANNRVILATDGDFNVGYSSPEQMKEVIAEKRRSGIFLSVLGFGNGNYNDALMQSLAQNGNGVAAYIDSLSEANKVLADEAGSSLLTIAKDVKIQVEFNPATIAEYRLIGYETRALRREDFNNDAVDAGDIGAGHSVTAIYELTPVGSPAQMVDELRYVDEGVETPNTGSNEFAFVKIRHKLPDADTSTLQTFPIGEEQEQRLSRASDDMRFATAVAAFGQKLRGDTQLVNYSYDDAIKLAASARGEDDGGYRSEFIQLAKLAKNLDTQD